MNERYLTTAEVADRCRTTVETVRYWRHTDYVPRGFKVGRRVLYAESEVHEWLARLRRESPEPAA